MLAAELLLVAIVPALLAMAAAWDLVTFTIPNLFSASLAVLFLAFCTFILSGASVPTTIFSELGWHFVSGFVALAAGVALFSTGLIGGGDAKLFAAASLWLGWNALFEYVLYASLLGGALTITLLALRKLPIPAVLHHETWLQQLMDRKRDVPYGIALAAGALIVLPESDLFRLIGG